MSKDSIAKDNKTESKRLKSGEKNTKTLWEGIKGIFSWLLIAFSWILFFSTFIWVILAAIVWPTENTKYFREFYKLDDNRSLKVWGPMVVPGESINVEIQFTLHQENISNIPQALFVMIPKEFAVISPVNDKYNDTVTLNFNGKFANETQTLQIRNSQIVSGLKVAEKELIIYREKLLEEKNKLGIVSIGAEPTFRAALRGYGGGGSQIPLLPLTTLLISVAGWSYRELQQRKLDEEKKAEQLKELARSSFSGLRQAIKNGQIELANQKMGDVLQKKLVQYLDEDDLQTAQRLLNIAAGNIEQAQNELFLDPWLDESAIALLYAIEHNPKDRKSLTSMLREFPFHEVRNEETRTKLQLAKSIFGSNDPVQSRETIYPEQVKLPPFIPPFGSLDKNPFPYDTAEDETPYLFAKNEALFWSEHPLTKKLSTTRGAVLVCGEKGSGKTALAMALGKYRQSANVSSDVFSCYLRGTPALGEIRSALSNGLLSFIEHFPSFLVLLHDEQRNLLAQTLSAELDKDILLGRLAYMSNPSRWEWLKAGDEKKRKIWETETRTHLNMLTKAVTNTSPRNFTNDQWLAAFMTCIHYSLNFEQGTYIVIDSDDEFAWDWYNEIIARDQHNWEDINLHTITFYSPQKRSKRQKESPWLKKFDLKWDEDKICGMAQWRWNAIYPRQPFTGVFSGNSFETLIQLSEKNPRGFIRLWNVLFENTDETLITESAVRKAKEKISCL